MSQAPEIKTDPMYQLLRDENIEEFNSRKAKGESCDLVGTDLRSMDLRGLDAIGLDMSRCYLRQADLRGIDFRMTNLEGASIKGAKISGAYFPVSLSPEEITLSLLHGTCMRKIP